MHLPIQCVATGILSVTASRPGFTRMSFVKILAVARHNITNAKFVRHFKVYVSKIRQQIKIIKNNKKEIKIKNPTCT